MYNSSNTMRPAIAALPTWTIDTTPTLELRTTEDDAFTVIGDLMWWSDDRVLVADRRHRDVREYAADGTLTRVLARNGQGPGESQLRHASAAPAR
jgi:hypothetical protein